MSSWVKQGPVRVKTTLLKAFVVSTFGVVIAYAMIIGLIPLFGETINPSAWVLGAVGPYVIGMPVATFCFWQSDRLRVAHEQLMEAHEALREKSMRDQMTGMLNRETFLSQLERRRRRSDNGVLLIADADHFKSINDGYGHLTGDKALLMISDAIKSSVRDHDLVGRIGGEEFGIFVSGADFDEAKAVSERMRRQVEALQFHTSCGANISLTISTGGAAVRDAENLSQLMRNADRSLYEAKRNGRNRVIFDAEIAEAA